LALWIHFRRRERVRQHTESSELSPEEEAHLKLLTAHEALHE
jgi:hypothetical protein